MIVTVPNSGTRSLRKHLGNTSWFHFGRHEDRYLKRDEPISTTVRDPLRTAISWVVRHGGMLDVFLCHETMIETCRVWPFGVDYYRTDELPVHEAEGEPSILKMAYDDHNAAQLREYIDVTKRWIEPWQDFYDEHLGTLWWNS